MERRILVHRKSMPAMLFEGLEWSVRERPVVGGWVPQQAARCMCTQAACAARSTASPRQPQQPSPERGARGSQEQLDEGRRKGEDVAHVPHARGHAPLGLGGLKGGESRGKTGRRCGGGGWAAAWGRPGGIHAGEQRTQAAPRGALVSGSTPATNWHAQLRLHTRQQPATHCTASAFIRAERQGSGSPAGGARTPGRTWRRGRGRAGTARSPARAESRWRTHTGCKGGAGQGRQSERGDCGVERLSGK